MKILLAHNHYGSFAQGGERIVFENERDLLRRYGHEVETYERSNSEINLLNMAIRTVLSGRLGWSKEIYDESTRLIKTFRPDVLHVHNYKYVFTSSIFEAAHDLGVGVVLSLHNYRLICPGGQLRRGNEVCEECVRGNPARSLWRSGCSSKFSARVAQYMFFCQTRERILNNVDAFIVPTAFGKQKFMEAGFPGEKVWVKPYSLSDVGTFGANVPDVGALFVGRLSAEKGVRFLIDAWRDVDYPLTVVGDGPESEWLKEHATSNVRFLGSLSHEETLAVLKKSDFLVFPSICHEGLGMTLIEACAVGKPIVASNLGGRAEIVEHGVSGLLFESGNKKALIDSVRFMIFNPKDRGDMGKEARRKYESSYTPERDYDALLKIYNSVLVKK